MVASPGVGEAVTAEGAGSRDGGDSLVSADSPGGAETNFNERDPEGADVARWADYWASAKVEGGGAVGCRDRWRFIRRRVPFFHRSAYLNGRDLCWGVCAGGEGAGDTGSMGRMSPDIQWTDPKLLAAHPLWFRRNQDGSLQVPGAGYCVYVPVWGGSIPSSSRRFCGS